MSAALRCCCCAVWRSVVLLTRRRVVVCVAWRCSMRGGELFDRLIQRGAYSEAEARQPFHQVAMALSYLHKYDAP